MPTPRTDESQEDFVSRCIPMVIDEGAEQDQAEAICFDIYDRTKMTDKLFDVSRSKNKPSNEKRLTFDSFTIGTKTVHVDNEEMKVATFEGVANVMEHEDLGGDVIHKGAFKKTLEEKEGKVPFVTDHTYKVDNYVGVAFLEEQGNLLKANVEVLLTNNKAGKEFYTKAKFANSHGEPFGMSIGYDIPKGKSEMKNGQRHIYEIKLYELSGVLFPMNELSRAVGFKDLLNGDEDLTAQELLAIKHEIDQAIKEKGESLGKFLNRAVSDMVTEDSEREEVLERLSEHMETNIDRVLEVLNGEIIRPSDAMLETFAEVLDLPMEQLRTLADNDAGKSDEPKEQKEIEELEECYTKIKSLLSSEPSDDTHKAEADLSEALTQIKQINQHEWQKH